MKNSPQSHAYTCPSKDGVEAHEGGDVEIGYVDTVNLQSHRPITIRQPTSGLRVPPSSMVFTMADVRELNPERGRGAKGPPRERSLISLIYKVSPRKTRGRLCRGTSLPHKKKRNLRFNASAEPVRNQYKAGIIRGGDFHCYYISVH